MFDVKGTFAFEKVKVGNAQGPSLKVSAVHFSAEFGMENLNSTLPFLV